MQWQRIHRRTVVVPALAAVLCGGLAAYGEIVVVASAWDRCEGINAAANSFGLVLVALPVLWLVQAVGVAVPAPFLALLSRNRHVVAGLMVLLVVIVLVGTAWTAWGLAGLPVQGGPCGTPHPSWWPHWLPPAPGYPD